MTKRYSDDNSFRSSYDWSTTGAPASETHLFSCIRQMLPTREWPAAECLTDVELISTLNEIEFELLQHQIQVDFLDRLPARVAYRGILQLLDSPMAVAASSYAIKHVDGCDSACESCFQLAYCKIAKDVLGAEWTLAVENAGVNPSWSALFSKETDE